jgi:hypothetical protein
MYQIKEAINALCGFQYISEESDLLTYIMSGLSIIYSSISHLLIYPVFTLLFFALLVIIVVLFVYSIKKYLQCEILLAAKIFIVAILASFALLDVYLIAFGKTEVFILYIKIQKDIFFILCACFIGLMAGRLLFKGSSSDEVMP